MLFAVALSVGLVPEALPVIITLTLSNGSIALSKQGVIVKRLSAIEDLGNVDVLCFDKTGTLTEDKVILNNYFDGANVQREELLEYALLCNAATVHGNKVSGNPIDVSIMQFALSKKFVLPSGYKKVKLIPFDFERRRMSVVVEKNGSLMFITKGAPETVLAICDSALINGKEVKIEKIKKKLEAMYTELGEAGYRSIAVAYKKLKKMKDYSKDDGRELVFLGFLTFFDPPKKTVKTSLEMAKKLGVSLKLITGDNPTVAKSVARQVGFEFSDSQVFTGDQLSKLSEEKFKQAVENGIIFVRVSPIQKYQIVRALKKNGHVVAFLGDGVNDAPALKEADVGISVNSGADVTKEAADVILVHKSINAVIQGISGGRKVFSNVVKYIINTIAGNFGNLYTIAISSLFIPFIPLSAVQILLANFLSDAPMVSISTDNVDDEELLKPKKWKIDVIAKFGALLGSVGTIFDLILIVFLMGATLEVFRTGLFLEIILSEIVVLMILRSNRPFFLAEPPSAPLFITSVLSVLLGIAVIYTPLGQLFGFVPLEPRVLLFIIVVVIAYASLTEIVKLIYRKFFEPPLEIDEKALALLRKKIVPELH